MPVLALAFAALLAQIRPQPADRRPAHDAGSAPPPLSREDAALVEELALLEKVELLENLDLFEDRPDEEEQTPPRAGEQPAPQRKPPAQEERRVEP